MKRLNWLCSVAALSMCLILMYKGPSDANPANVLVPHQQTNEIETITYTSLVPGQAYALEDSAHPGIYLIGLKSASGPDLILHSARKIKNHAELNRILKISGGSGTSPQGGQGAADLGDGDALMDKQPPLPEKTTPPSASPPEMHKNNPGAQPQTQEDTAP